MSQNAIIYCRVSTKAQTIRGSGLDSQETRCRQYAEMQGYNVAAVFPDDVSGGGDFMNRPGMVALLSFLDAQPDKNYVIIFDDLKRFARDTIFHLKLRQELSTRGARPECLNFKFDDTPEGEFIETIIAAQGQLERQKNRRQVKQKMKARVENGYWVSHAPVGFKYATVKGHGKLLVRDEPLASIVQEALEGFASARFETRAEVKRFLESRPEFPRTRHGHVTNETVNRILNRPHYAGYIEFPTWDVSLREGHHEGLISLATYQTIQRRLHEKPKAAARPDVNADFPLRGFILCNDCCNPLTASWSTSKTGKRHPYYHCFTKGCESNRKTIRRDVLEGEFEGVMRTLQPSETAYALLRDMFKHAWDMRGASVKKAAQSLSRKLSEVEAQIAALLDRIVDASSPRVISAYEAKIDALEQEKLVLGEKLQNAGQPRHRFEDMFELACQFLSNPWKLWESGDLAHRRTVLKLAFQERLSYCRENGLRTPKTTLPFNMLAGVFESKGVMAERQGFEPWVPVKAQRFSRPPRSTTPAPLHRLISLYISKNDHNSKLWF